jgi:hypothetical protein
MKIDCDLLNKEIDHQTNIHVFWVFERISNIFFTQSFDNIRDLTRI